MEAIVKLKIYTVEHAIFGDSVETIFEDTKNKDYNSYEEIQASVLKLADATRKFITDNNKTGKQQEFDIYVTIDNFQVATYHSYVSSINRHLKKGYEQGYKDWETFLNVIAKYGTKKPNINKITVNRTKLLKDIVYRLQKFHDFVIANIGKEFRLKDSVSNDWNGWIEGFEFQNNGNILIRCYWQGDSTDGTQFVKYDGNPIYFNAKEYSGINKIKFTKEQVNEAILNLLLENCNLR